MSTDDRHDFSSQLLARILNDAEQEFGSACAAHLRGIATASEAWHLTYEQTMQRQADEFASRAARLAPLVEAAMAACNPATEHMYRGLARTARLDQIAAAIGATPAQAEEALRAAQGDWAGSTPTADEVTAAVLRLADREPPPRLTVEQAWDRLAAGLETDETAP